MAFTPSLPRPRPLAFLLGVLVALLSWAALAAPADASRGQVTVFQDDHAVFDELKRPAFLEELRSLGVDWVRVNVIWNQYAPSYRSRRKPRFDETDPTEYRPDRIAALDRVVRDIAAHGMQPLLTITGPGPRWASGGKRSYVYKLSPTRFGRFAQAIGDRYSGRYEGVPRVRRFSIYNEPNQPGWLQPQYSRGRPYSPYLYRRMYRKAEAALRRSGHRTSRVYIGNTAPLGSARRRTRGAKMLPGIFVRELFCFSRRSRGCRRPKKLRSHGFAHHPYVQHRRKTPFSRGKRHQFPVGSTRNLVRLLDSARRKRRVNRRLNVYFTEYGRQTNPPDRRIGVSRSRQARYINQTEYLAYRNRRVKSYSQYLMYDDPELNLFQTGLRFVGGKAKPALRAFRTPLVVRRTSRRRVSFWGHIRPNQGRERLTLQYRNRGSRKWRKLKRKRTDRRGYWRSRSTYRSGRRWRVQWKDADGKTHTGPSTPASRF